MAPFSYQGPMEQDETKKTTHSQTDAWTMGASAPGLTVEAIIAHKGDSVYSVSPHQSVKDVVSDLARLRVGALVVVNAANEPVGIVSERDLVHKLDTNGAAILDAPVETIMTANPVTCTPTITVEEVMKTMTSRRFRHMPVLKDGKLAGVVSIGDVVRHRMQEIEYESLKIKQAIVG
jgi:CBS domain-containing protein